MLVLVATPIGNLSDITLRALEELKSADIILCEDTRHSLTLLRHYEIHKPLESYHDFNEKHKISSVIEKLESGKKICLISDAGTPLISDPGLPLVKACLEKNIIVTSTPGPCSLIYALCCSGLPTDKFQFIGFLPKEEEALYDSFEEILFYEGVSICFEPARRVLQTLKKMAPLYPNIETCVALELTKLHERFFRGPIDKIISELPEDSLKGECVLLFKVNRTVADTLPIDLKADVEVLTNHFKIPLKQALKALSVIRGVRKRDLYQEIAIKHS